MANSLLLVFVLATPLVGGVGNTVSVSISGNDNHVASCQLVIFVGAVLYLGVEDGLGLVELPATSAQRRALVDSLPMPQVDEPAATCESVVRELRVGDGGPTRVTGGRPLAASMPFANAETSLVPNANSVAICQTIVLVDSVVIGGGSFGLTSDDDGVAALHLHEGEEPRSRCRADVERVLLTG